MSKVILSFLLLVVLQSVMTEGKEACPAGMTADKTGKCVVISEQIVPLGGLRQMRTDPEPAKNHITEKNCPFPSWIRQGKCIHIP
ncbi:UNVERIFIED_CONTAM: hypothetical protein PYX00_004216 [Menopon gallinae]|uniref:Uncharacterized protein n=1 Tax=Menopon gallinae TaxID=328185 RepID=A0AAW2I4D2_9NEOP